MFAPGPDNERLWGPGGTVAIAAANAGVLYSPRNEQTLFGGLTAELLRRRGGYGGPAGTGIALIEAGTGIGKTLGYLVPGCMHISAHGGKMMIATQSHALMAQIMGEDQTARRAGNIEAGGDDQRIAVCVADHQGCLDSLAGKTPAISRRLLFAKLYGRRNFLSVTRMRMVLNEWKSSPAKNTKDIITLGGLIGDQDKLNEMATSIMAVLDTNKTLPDTDRAKTSAYHAAQELLRDGLVKTFITEMFGEDEGEDADEDRLALTDDVRLLCTSPAPDHAVYRLAKRLATDADVLVTTHAMVAVALSLRSLPGLDRAAADLFDCDAPSLTDYEFLVIDEADQWESSAMSVLTQSVSLHSLKRTIQRAIDAANDTPLQKAIAKAGSTAIAVIEDLLTLAPQETGASALVNCGDQAMDRLNSLSTSLAAMHDGLKRAVATGGTDGGALAEMALRLARLVRTSKSNTDFWKMRWKTSRTKAVPSIEAFSAAPGRIMKRIWTPKDDETPLAKSILITSATLCTPGKYKDEKNQWLAIESETGIRPDVEEVVHRDLCAIIHPANFGKLTFRPSLPWAPVPKADGKGSFSAPVLEHWLAVIKAARSQGGRVFVLTPAYRDIEQLAPHFADDPDVLIQLNGRQPLQPLEKRYRDPRHRNKVLISAGTWAGINWPRMIDHLVVLRLPFPPPKAEEEGFSIVDLIKMLKKLAQGVGRAIRTEDSVATFWCADPRMGCPEPLQKRAGLGLVPFPMGRRALSAIPERFLNAMDRDPSLCEFAIDWPKPAKPANATKKKAKTQGKQTPTKLLAKGRRK